MLRKFLIVLSLLLFISGQAFGHDFWIEKKDNKLFIVSGHDDKYVGTETNPRRGPVYDIYTVKATYKLKNWSTFVSTAYQPCEYSSDGMWSSGGFVNFNPKPAWDVTAGVKYQF